MVSGLDDLDFGDLPLDSHFHIERCAEEHHLVGADVKWYRGHWSGGGQVHWFAPDESLSQPQPGADPVRAEAALAHVGPRPRFHLGIVGGYLFLTDVAHREFGDCDFVVLDKSFHFVLLYIYFPRILVTASSPME